MRSLRRLSLALVAVALVPGCRQHRASPEDCKAVLDRLIDVELAELGYRDPVLRTRWHEELERRFAPDLDDCRGFRVRNDLRVCLDAMPTSAVIISRCLE